MSSPLVHPKLNKIDSSMKTIMKYMKKYQYLGEGEIYCNGAISFRYKTIKKGEYELWLRIGLSDVIRKYNNDSASFIKTAKSFNNKERIADIEKFFIDNKDNMDEIIKRNSPLYNLITTLENVKETTHINGSSPIRKISIDEEHYIQFWGDGYSCELTKTRTRTKVFAYIFSRDDGFGEFKLSKKEKANNQTINKEFFDDIAKRINSVGIEEMMEYCKKISAVLAKYQVEFINSGKNEIELNASEKLIISYQRFPNKIENSLGFRVTNTVGLKINDNYICLFDKNKKLSFRDSDSICNYNYIKNLYEKLDEYYPKFLEEIKGMYSID